MSTLTNKQSDRLLSFFETFYFEARDSNIVPRSLVRALAMLNSMLQRKLFLQQEELVLLQWSIELFFQVNRDFRDEHLESAYFRLFGEWPVDPPWYVVQKNLPHR